MQIGLIILIKYHIAFYKIHVKLEVIYMKNYRTAQ